MPSSKKNQWKILLPLLNVLRTVKPEQRTILLAHMDDKTREYLYQTISHVLRSQDVPMNKRIFLRNKLDPYKNDLRILMSKKASKKKKQHHLAQIGAGPMSYVLKEAIPLLLQLFPS